MFSEPFLFFKKSFRVFPILLIQHPQLSMNSQKGVSTHKKIMQKGKKYMILRLNRPISSTDFSLPRQRKMVAFQGLTNFGSQRWVQRPGIAEDKKYEECLLEKTLHGGLWISLSITVRITCCSNQLQISGPRLENQALNHQQKQASCPARKAHALLCKLFFASFCQPC